MLINQILAKVHNKFGKFFLQNLSALAHSWFATVVDGHELGPVYHFQLKQLKYVDPKVEGAVGATMDFMVDFGIDIHFPLKKIGVHVHSSL